MSDLNQITNAASYTGNAALGGAGELAINIDTRPIQQLAQYTFLYNRSQYDQAQKDADEKIKKIGALAPYDLINGIEKDATEVKDAQAKLTNYLAEYAAKGTPKSPKDKIQQELDLQKEISGQLKLINSANARKIKLDTYTNAVQADNKLSAQEKELRINQAKGLFNDSDIFTLPDIPNHDLSMPQNSAPVIDSVSVIKTGADGNAVIDETIKQFSIGNNWKTSYLDANNLTIPTLPQNASKQQKDEYEQKKLSFSKNGIGAWQNAAEAYNHALTDPNYKKTVETTDINIIGADPNVALTTEVDVDKIKQDNPIVGGIISLAERYNNYATKRLEDIKNGYYIDSVTGEKVLLTGGDKVSDIKFIDVTKPLKPEDLSFLDKFEKAAPDQIDKKFIQTDNAIQGQQMATQIKLKKIDEAGANYRARLPYIYAKIGNGTATKDEKSDYPVLKTQELVETIGDKTVNFKDLTPEQQSKIQSQGIGKITDISTVSIDGNKIKVTGTFTDKKNKKEATPVPVTITIIPDDITKAYYDEVNKNDAGKEAPERKYFKFGETKTTTPDANIDKTGTFIYNGKEGSYQQLVDAFGEDAVLQGINLKTIKKK